VPPGSRWCRPAAGSASPADRTTEELRWESLVALGRLDGGLSNETLRLLGTLINSASAPSAIREGARRYGWTIHSIAVQSDHVHVVITACREGEQFRDALKAVASRALNREFGKRDWWAEKGSAKYLWERTYFENARDYVRDQRDF